MSGATLVVFAGGLFALFLLIVAGLMWQEGRRRSTGEPLDYVINDVVAFITEQLAPDVSQRIGRADVQRIIEWEVFYLQGLAQKRRSTPVETVAGGDAAAVAYIGRQIAESHDVIYDSADIATVLGLEAEYLVSIGAVGDPVVEQQREDDPR